MANWLIWRTGIWQTDYGELAYGKLEKGKTMLYRSFHQGEVSLAYIFFEIIYWLILALPIRDDPDPNLNFWKKLKNYAIREEISGKNHIWEFLICVNIIALFWATVLMLVLFNPSRAKLEKWGGSLDFQ